MLRCLSVAEPVLGEARENRLRWLHARRKVYIGLKLVLKLEHLSTSLSSMFEERRLLS